MPKYKYFDVQRRRAVVEIHLADTKYFGSSEYAALQQELRQFVQDEKPPNLLVDFGRIEYCSTAVMNGLLQVRNMLSAEGQGRRIKFCGMRDEVREAFRMLKLDGPVFDIYPTAKDAVAAF